MFGNIVSEDSGLSPERWFMVRVLVILFLVTTWWLWRLKVIYKVGVVHVSLTVDDYKTIERITSRLLIDKLENIQRDKRLKLFLDWCTWRLENYFTNIYLCRLIRLICSSTWFYSSAIRRICCIPSDIKERQNISC